jgi:hypothetical protein
MDLLMEKGDVKKALFHLLDSEFSKFRLGKIADVNQVAKFLECQGFTNRGAMNAALDFENHKRGV